MSGGREAAPSGVGEISGGGPLIIGHRGASAHAPENTHAAFEQAFTDGADGIELDVRLARDDLPVVIHDATFPRTVGIEGEMARFDSTLLAKFHCGEWFNERYPRRARWHFADEHIPTLEQVYERYGSGVIYVEMKCEEVSRRAALARAVVEMTRAHKLAPRVVVKSFEHDSLAEVKRLAPEIRTAALFGRSWPHPLVPASKIIAAAGACGADEISLHHSLVRRATVERARGLGFEVLAWTVNSPLWLRRALSLGLRAVFTDYPGRMRAALAKLRPRRTG
ncbi:MAG TPA: glycerophosphodiester phosphodiesterase family protein [Pyrinomonadaceae bacterium]|jgi:glycerophosphoryl diester phosphodiesterase